MLTTPHPLIVGPYTRKTDPGVRHSDRFLVLFADNDPFTLRTALDYFENSEFDIITVGSEQAARILIDLNADALDAIVLDGRLTDDENDMDRSGYELAAEVSARFPDPPRVLIFSRYEDSREGEVERDGIIFVSKYAGYAGYEVLMEELRKLINLRMSDAPHTTHRPISQPPPVIILGGEADDADRLRAELMKYDIYAVHCTDLSVLQEIAPHLPPAMIVVDLDASRPSEGVEAIRSLKKLQEESGRPFYVVTLSGHEEVRHEAAQVGAQVFLLKASSEIDALELITRMAQYKMELERAVAAEQLAAQGYQKLLGQLEEVRESPERGMSAPLEMVRRALNWSFLMPKEQLVLSSLYTQMLAARERTVDAATIDLCIEGAAMLAADRARAADVRQWLERARRHSPDFTLVWLDEEVFDGGPEESDN